MPKEKVSLIRQFYTFDAAKCQSICQISVEKICPDDPIAVEVKPCTTIISGNHASNLERHVRSCHSETYRKYAEEKQNALNCSSSTQSKTEGYGFVKKMNSIVDAIVELITVNGRSIEVMQVSGFKKILEPILKSVNFSLEDIEIEKFISMKANMIREKIIRTIKNKLISIKIDYVTRFSRCFLSINIQLYESGKLNTYVISVIELEGTCNLESLKTIVHQELNRFQIHTEQIYTITTDNATYYTSALDNCLNAEDEDAEEHDEDFEDEVNSVDLVSLTDDMSHNDESESHNFVPGDFEDTCLLLDQLCKDLNPDICSQEPLNPTNIISNGIRCAEYTLQQTITDTLKESKLEAIDAARSFVKKLKSPRALTMLKVYLLDEPLLDNPISWTSTYDMLIKLFKIRGICHEVENEYFNIPHNYWITLAAVVEALKPCKKATLQLQKDNATLSDVYKIYSICIMELTKMEIEFALLLAKNLESKIEILFTNIPFLSAMFLDPRFTVTLEDNYKEEAIKHLIAVYIKILKLHSHPPVENTGSTSDGMEDFESLLESCENLNKNKKLKREPNHLESLLRKFGSHCRVNSKELITQFWEQNKITNPELYKLACVLFQVHASQLSTKKLFSHLSFLSDPSHPKLSSRFFNDFMVVRINFHVVGNM